MHYSLKGITLSVIVIINLVAASVLAADSFGTIVPIAKVVKWLGMGNLLRE